MYIQSFYTIAIKTQSYEIAWRSDATFESNAILLHAVWLVISLPENYATCSYTLLVSVDRHLDQSKDVTCKKKTNTLYVEYIQPRNLQVSKEVVHELEIGDIAVMLI